ncbi:19441_t:CDS:2, partial [Gigaspora margarita]
MNDRLEALKNKPTKILLTMNFTIFEGLSVVEGVRAWKDKIIVYANIKKSIKTIYLKLSVLATVTAILSTLRLFAVISVVDFIHMLMHEDDNAVVWLVTTTRDNYGERTTHYTILKGFKPLNKKEMINKPMVLTRILAGFAM